MPVVYPLREILLELVREGFHCGRDGVFGCFKVERRTIQEGNVTLTSRASSPQYYCSLNICSHLHTLTKVTILFQETANFSAVSQLGHLAIVGILTINTTNNTEG